jgi:hypothetical protein
MISRRSIAVIAAWLAVSAAAADVVVTKDGEQIGGKVTGFESGSTLANSHFVIEVDGGEKKIPLFKIDSVTFDRAGEVEKPVAQKPPSRAKKDAVEAESDGKSRCISSTGKRHNSSCRYYGTGKCKPCGPKDGVACKVCGG